MKKYQNEQLLRECYEKHKSMVEVAKELEANEKTIAIWMKKFNIQNVGTQGARKNNFNHDYFKEIDTEEKAYWLGFIMADGCVYKGSKGTSYRLQINLKSTDIEHLNKFQQSIGSSYKIQVKKIKQHEACLLKVNSTIMCKDLMKWNVIPSKSLICEMPILKKELKKHFIRGYFDGDGSLDLHKKKDPRARIVGGETMLQQIKDFLDEEGMQSKVAAPTKNKSTYTLEIPVGKESMKFMSWLYEDSSISLDRKVQRYETYNVPFRSNPVDKIQVNCGESLRAFTTNHVQG